MKLQAPTNKNDRMNTKSLLKTILAVALGTGLTVAAWAAPAVVEQGTDHVDIYQDVDLSDWIGEWVHEDGGVTFNYHRVQLPNGDYVYHDLWFQTTSTLTGLKTGTKWILQRNVSPDVIRSTGGGMIMWTTLSIYVSETGPTIHIHYLYHISYDANGELRVQRDGGRLWLKD
jgi:hypothetical protein